MSTSDYYRVERGERIVTSPSISDYFDWLGYHARDRVTGFTGVADSVCFDLYGCVQVSLTPQSPASDKEWKPGRWFDVKRLERTSDTRVMEPPRYSAPGSEIGAADKAPPDRDHMKW